MPHLSLQNFRNYLRPCTFLSLCIISHAIGSAQAADAQLQLEPRCKPLPFCKGVPLVLLDDGSLLTVEGTGTIVSRDDGQSWSAPRPIGNSDFSNSPKIESGEYCSLLRTRGGTVVLLYMDNSNYAWQWDPAANRASDNSRLDVWAIRSADNGNNWSEPVKVFEGYCGALIGMIELADGRIVAPMQDLAPDRTRHICFSLLSENDGQTWRQSNMIDLGGRGDHDGALEPTVAQLSDGRLYMLIRTNLDRFWEAFSDDGRYWRTIRPSDIDASSAPGFLLRLSSGRLALVWNRLYAEGKNSTDRWGGGGTFCEPKTSMQREELSLAFSDDDGKTWTKPVVIARQPGAWLSYPFVLERRPGELWIITRFSAKVCFSLQEKDFVESK